MGKTRICHTGGEGIFISAFSDGSNIPAGLGIGVLMVYCFMGVAIASDIFMGSIEAVTNWKKQVRDPETGRMSTVNMWNSTVATLTLMALGSSAPEIFLAVIENFKNDFHAGDLGPSTIVGSAAFNLFMIIAVCITVIPAGDVRKITHMKAFVVTALFSIVAYGWMVFVISVHGPNVVDLYEAIATFVMFPLLVWVSYSADVGIIAKKIKYCFPDPVVEEHDAEAHATKASCYKIGFASSDKVVEGSAAWQHVDVVIVRHGAELGAVSFSCRTERFTAVPGYDYEEHDSQVDFPEGESEVLLQLVLRPQTATASKRQFLLVLANEGETNCDFDPDGDGGVEAAILTITVQPANATQKVCFCHEKCLELDNLNAIVNSNSARYAFAEWLDQIKGVLFVNGSLEEQREAGLQDWIYHIFATPWNIIFALVPPTSFFGGWLCFVIAIICIGFVTAFLSDLAEMFGCLVDLPDIVTAAVFVALGTSVPDLFASIGAAVDSPDADAAIVNVTGSNAVNVFLGLGIPWVCSAVYWNFFGERTPDWVARYPLIAADARYAGTAVFVVDGGHLSFYVAVFTCLSILALLMLVMRRKLLGAELGGPKVPKYLSATLLVCMWLVFISITSWKVLRCDGSASGDWCAASIEEQVLVLGLLGFLLMAVGVPTVISTCVYSRQALADIRGEESDPKDVDKFEQIEIKVLDSSNPVQSQANLFKAEETPDSAADVGFTKREASEGSSDAPSTEALNKQITDSPKVKQQLEWYSTGSRGSGRSLGVHPSVQSLQPALKVRSKPSLTSSRSTASLGSHKSANSAEAGNVNSLPVVSEAANLPQQHTMP